MKNSRLFKFTSSLLIGLVASVCSMSYAVETVDVLVLYTPGTAAAYNGDPTTRFQQLIAFTNQVYADSGVNAELNLVHAEQITYTDDNSAETALNAITSGALNATAASLREQYKADMVIFYRPYKDSHGSCGLAWVGGYGTGGDFSNTQWRNYMMAHVGITVCGDYVTAHELGHNMGLKHSRKQDGTGGTLPYALGYGVVGSFTTIMAYQSEFSVDYWTGKVYKFSSPNLTCKGVPCGIDRNNAQGSDAVYALNLTIPQIAQFSSNSVVSPLDALAKKVADAKTVWDTAVAAVNTNKAAITTKTATLTAAKTAQTAAATEAKSALAAYKKALTAYTTAAKTVTATETKLNAAKSKYNTATGAAKETAATSVTTLTTQYSNQVKLAADALATSESLREISDAKAALLTTATAAVTEANSALTAEKALTAGLTAAVTKAKAAYDAALKEYNALLKKK